MKDGHTRAAAYMRTSSAAIGASALTVASNDGNRDKRKLVMIDDPRKTEHLLFG
jgi:hypothetical protein